MAMAARAALDCRYGALLIGRGQGARARYYRTTLSERWCSYSG
ncbi:oligoribonuclease [Nitrococcus mobilis Nb-231]|uniref:Oligoribonuclease n=1 Tax=Nitrococcus mobilis Nb-231 TaxID=314278 RepID=A4BT94_9GAMM|nr:oligoribonuclease [Nitrococcus mobilis Nb-231]